MQTPFTTMLKLASNIQRKQPQVTRDQGIALVAAAGANVAANIAGAGISGDVMNADGFTGRGWKSVGQQIWNTLVSKAARVRLNATQYASSLADAVAYYVSLYATTVVGFAAALTTATNDLGAQVQTVAFPILASDFTVQAAAAWDAATSRVVS